MKVTLILTAQSDADKDFLYRLFHTGLIGATATQIDQNDESCACVTVELPTREGFLG
jgi:hypothetical protein